MARLFFASQYNHLYIYTLYKQPPNQTKNPDRIRVAAKDGVVPFSFSTIIQGLCHTVLYYQQSVLAAGTWTIRIDVTRPELTGHSSGHLSKTSPNFLLLPVMHRNYHRGHFTRELNIMLSSEGIAYYWLY